MLVHVWYIISLVLSFPLEEEEGKKKKVIAREITYQVHFSNWLQMQSILFSNSSSDSD